MKIAVYPGSFDPVSNGHLDLIQRASQIFDKVYVLVSINISKKYMFNADERENMMKIATKDLKNVIVEQSDDLVLHFAKKKNAHVIIRGLRSMNEYQHEITLFQFNRSIDPSIDTFVLFPSANNLFLSSSSIKELVVFDENISNYVPKDLVNYITTEIRKRIHKN